MDLYQAIKERRSIRKFEGTEVPEDDVRAIIELATLAPNAGNRQTWYFVAVSDRDILDKMKQAVEEAIDKLADWPEADDRQLVVKAIKSYTTFFAEAPVTIAVFAAPYVTLIDDLLVAHGMTREEIDRYRARPDMQSIGAAVQTLSLVTHAKGYGTCWMSGPVLAAPVIEEMLETQEPWKLVALVPLGVPAETPEARPRRDLDEVLRVV